MKNMKISKEKLTNHKSAKSLNLKLDSIKNNYQNKIYEIYIVKLVIQVYQ